MPHCRSQEKGRVEGIAQALESIVIDAKLMNFSLEQIRMLTKLTEEQITEILKRTIF